MLTLSPRILYANTSPISQLCIVVRGRMVKNVICVTLIAHARSTLLYNAPKLVMTMLLCYGNRGKLQFACLHFRTFAYNISDYGYVTWICICNEIHSHNLSVSTYLQSCKEAGIVSCCCVWK